MKNQNLSHQNKLDEKQKIEELKKKKREMEEELDEMQGRTTKGKVICAVVFLLTVALLMFFFVGMVKLDVGGISSEILAPIIGDVPVLRSVLPAELQRKTPAELQAEMETAQAASQTEAEAETEAKAETEAEAQTEAETEAEAEAALQDYVDTYSAMRPKDAAKVFDSMMPDQEELIVKILEKLTPDQRAAILSKMSVTNAATLTTKMEQ